jgi:hypothetical protein
LPLIFADAVLIYYLKAKEHDLKVLSEVSQIRSALETYLMLNNYYPLAEEPTKLNDSYLGTEKLCTDGFYRINVNCSKEIIKPIPQAYLAQGETYIYQTNDARNFKLEFTLKTNFKAYGLLKGKNCANNAQISSRACF